MIQPPTKAYRVTPNLFYTRKLLDLLLKSGVISLDVYARYMQRNPEWTKVGT